MQELPSPAQEEQLYESPPVAKRAKKKDVEVAKDTRRAETAKCVDE